MQFQVVESRNPSAIADASVSAGATNEYGGTTSAIAPCPTDGEIARQGATRKDGSSRRDASTVATGSRSSGAAGLSHGRVHVVTASATVSANGSVL